MVGYGGLCLWLACGGDWLVFDFWFVSFGLVGIIAVVAVFSSGLGWVVCG